MTEVADPLAEQRPGTPARPTLLFRVGSTQLGLNALHVDEVCDDLSLTPLPGVPPHISGLLNLRGQPVPVVDLARLLELEDGAEVPGGQAPSASDRHVHRPRILVVRWGDVRTGLRCHGVLGLVEVTAPEPAEVALGSAMRAVADRVFDGPRGVTVELSLEALVEVASARG